MAKLNTNNERLVLTESLSKLCGVSQFLAIFSVSQRRIVYRCFQFQKDLSSLKSILMFLNIIRCFTPKVFSALHHARQLSVLLLIQTSAFTDRFIKHRTQYAANGKNLFFARFFFFFLHFCLRKRSSIC